MPPPPTASVCSRTSGRWKAPFAPACFTNTKSEAALGCLPHRLSHTIHQRAPQPFDRAVAVAAQPPGAEKYLSDVDGNANGQRAGNAEAAEQAETVAVKDPAKDDGLREVVGERHPSQRCGPAEQPLSALEIGDADDASAITQSQQDRAERLCQGADPASRDQAAGMAKDQCRTKANTGDGD